jgi:hypothetical protein
MCVTRPDGRILDVNGAMLALVQAEDRADLCESGRTLQELVGGAEGRDKLLAGLADEQGGVGGGSRVELDMRKLRGDTEITVQAIFTSVKVGGRRRHGCCQ